MKALASPAGLAVVALLLAIAVHPELPVARLGAAGSLLVPLLALLLGLALVLAAWRGGTALRWIAAGTLLVLAAAGYDTARGRSGRLTLEPGGGTQTFEEEGPGGAVLGLRPLGFDLKLERLTSDGATLEVAAPAHTWPAALVGPHQPLASGPFRLGWRSYEAQPRLSIRVSRGQEHADVDVSAEAPAAVDDLDLALSRYFPDFALDARNEPYSRSTEPRNPAALLRVRRAGKEWTVFVLRAVPGLHEIPDLGATFGLNAVAVDERLVLGVHQEPAVLAVAFGMALAVLGLALGVRR